MADPADLRAFAARDWAAVERNTAEYWRAWKQRHGAAGAIRIADELRRQAIAQRPDWPTHAERMADLECHLRVAEALRRVPARRR